MAERINWYRTPVKRENLRALTKKSNASGLFQAGGFLLVFIATAGLSLYFFVQQMWIMMIVACYVHAMFHSFIGMEAAVHELSHGTAFASKGLNEFFYRLFSFLSWNNYLHFRVSHMRHHQLTVHRGLDKEVIIEPISFTWKDYLSWFTFDFTHFKRIMKPNIAHFFGKADVDVFFWDPLLPQGDPRRKTMCNWARFMFIGHLLLLALFIYFQLWVLIFVITFGYFFASFLGRACGALQHLGLHPSVPDWRVSCHTVKMNPVVAFLYWQMNYHIEHHMYAAVPFHRLKKLHAAIAADTPKPPRSFTAGLLRLRTIKKAQKKDPSYSYLPEFPDTATPPRMS
jgi:fatty acid desaturase